MSAADVERPRLQVGWECMVHSAHPRFAARRQCSEALPMYVERDPTAWEAADAARLPGSSPSPR